MAPPQTPVPFTLDLETGLCLALAFSFMPAAQLLASFTLPKSVPRTYYWIFVWGVYDFLTHSIIEGSFLYHCFFSYETVVLTSDYPHPASQGIRGPVLYGRHDRRYGSFYSDGPMARLWQEYAKADRRWGEADLNVISLEILTVFGAGPAAAYMCYLIAKISNTQDLLSKARLDARLWFVAIALSSAELYGGAMTFEPEWLSANSSLAGDDPVYLWLYLVFFNMIWVFVPLWILWESYHALSSAFVRGANVQGLKKAA